MSNTERTTTTTDTAPAPLTVRPLGMLINGMWAARAPQPKAPPQKPRRGPVQLRLDLAGGSTNDR